MSKMVQNGKHIHIVILIDIIKQQIQELSFPLRIDRNSPSYILLRTVRGGSILKGIVEERAAMLGEYIMENKATVRGAAKKFGVSKSTVHKDVSERLRKLNPQLYANVKLILDENKAERHIRGGLATRLKYGSNHHGD